MSMSITGKLDVTKLEEDMRKAASEAGREAQGKGAERKAGEKKKQAG